MSTEYSGERFLPAECKGEMEIEHFQRYQFARNFVKDKVVLDAACGEGYGSNILVETAKQVYGLDLDEKTVLAAEKKYGSEKLKYVAGSIAKLPFEENTFDVIISFETIEHVDGDLQQNFLEEIERVLKPNGMLIMSTPNKAVYTDLVKGENKFHIKEFYVQEYIDFLKQKFEKIELFCQYPSVGYYISKENETVKKENKPVRIEECRYVIAICANREISYQLDVKDYAYFDDSMYYFLNANAHELEKQLIQTKEEGDVFAAQLESSIKKQQEYIQVLENEIVKHKEYEAHLEKDMKELREYITHLENKQKKTRGFFKKKS